MRIFSLILASLIVIIMVATLWKTGDKPAIATIVKKDYEHTNHLVDSFSPYLRQHVHNPVDWYPWGEEAFEKARAENKPIFLSVGYSTCYWCHVMERVVFADEDAARLMNEHIVSIKVDREVRPDVDEVYMLATHLIRGQGGWPNNVLLTPDLKPFFASGTLMKEQMMDLMDNLPRIWKNQRPQLEAQANQIYVTMKDYLAGGKPLLASLSAPRFTEKYFSSVQSGYDRRYGGFGAGTKFPQEQVQLFLMDYADSQGNNQALEMVQNTVDHMIAGGIHDHVGGGFHRYATGQKWRVPHFEKMLYNQGQIAVVLSRLYEKTDQGEYKRVLERLLAYVSREMTSSDGRFYSALDAETDAVEGHYYVWNQKELQNILSEEEYDFFTSLYDTEALPHFPGHKYPDGEVLYRKKDLPAQSDWKKLDSVHEKLLGARSQRKRPQRDDKTVVAWNGMMISGYADAGRILENPAYIEVAEKAARFILDNMRFDDGRLYRIYIDGTPHQNAFLDDYAWLGRGLMAIYRATGNEYYKDKTIALMQVADQYFLDGISGGYYFTDSSGALPVRVRQGNDSGALPSANPVMAHVFADLYAATGDTTWRDKTESIAAAFAQGIIERPTTYGHMIYALLRTGEKQDEAWLDPLKIADTNKSLSPLQEESKNKVSVQAHILHGHSTPTKKMVTITLETENGWHVNANPASLEFLIPTVANVQTEQESTLQVSYPDGKKMETPLGSIDVYEGTVEIMTTVETDKPIDVSKMRVMLQVQACKGAICYPPSKISLNIVHDGC